MKRKHFSLLISFCIISIFVSAQDELNIKYGKISPKDFNITSPVVDSNSTAVILADIGNCSFEGNNSS